MTAPLANALALFLALVLGGASVHKFLDPGRASSAAAALIGLKAPAVLPALLAAVAEAVLALGLIAPVTRLFAAAGAVLLLAGYALLVRRAAVSGRASFDCGCSLSRRASSSKDQWKVTAALAILALLVALLPAPREADLPALLGAMAMASLYVALGELLSARKLRKAAF